MKALFLGLFFLAQLSFAATVSKKVKLENIEFVAQANVKAFNITGKVKDLNGSAEMEHDQIIRNISISVLTSTLSTGMSLRDKHMKEKIFTSKAGKLHDVVFTAETIKCENNSCPTTGSLEIQGVKKPFTTTLTRSTKGSTYRFTGSGVVKLSDYGIEQPQQLGVKVSNDVSVKIDILLE